MALDQYTHYWNQARGLSDRRRRDRMRRIRDKAGVDSGFGKAGDPLGAQTPMVQDRMLGQLARRAAGRIDDWESLIDPTVSYGSNLRKLQQNGAKQLDSTERETRKDFIESADSRAERHAKDRIRENIEAIDEGDKPQLVDDITAEFGAEFAESAIAEAKALELPTDPAGAPEPAPEPAEPSTPEPAPAPEPSAPCPDPEPADIAADGGFEPGLAAAAAMVGITSFRPTVGGTLRTVGGVLRTVAIGLLLAFGLLIRAGIWTFKLSTKAAVWGFWLLLAGSIGAVRLLSAVPVYLLAMLAVAAPAKRKTAPRVA